MFDCKETSEGEQIKQASRSIACIADVLPGLTPLFFSMASLCAKVSRRSGMTFEPVTRVVRDAALDRGGGAGTAATGGEWVFQTSCDLVRVFFTLPEMDAAYLRVGLAEES